MTEEGVLLVKCKVGNVSDGYHTFDELYKHRILLFIALCHSLRGKYDIWRSLKHSDGSEITGWFVMGINKEKGKQITYHLPIDMWRSVSFAETMKNAPAWDGHTSADVLDRLIQLY